MVESSPLADASDAKCVGLGGLVQSEPIPKPGWRIRASPALRFTSLSMSADIPFMPLYGRHFEPGQLQFITTSTYRRARLFDSDYCRGAAYRPLVVQCRERRVGQALPLHRPRQVVTAPPLCRGFFKRHVENCI